VLKKIEVEKEEIKGILEELSGKLKSLESKKGEFEYFII
jgi:hypothetical protein